MFEVGQHFYWSILGFEVHGQVLINTWIVISIIVFLGIYTTKNLSLIPEGKQSFIELVTEFVRDISKTQIGEKEYLKWVPYLGTMFLFIFVSNWSGAFVYVYCNVVKYHFFVYFVFVYSIYSFLPQISMYLPDTL